MFKTLTKKRARRHLRHFLAFVAKLNDSPFKNTGSNIRALDRADNCHVEIQQNNGITEGFHTKMEMMTRRAYGFRNFENYRLRVLAHCGWDGIIKRPI